MRELTVKYDGECKRCHNPLEVGQVAMYEKSMGIFCKGCEPTDPEDIRQFRQLKANIKADRYEEWAEKRENKANAQLNSYPTIRHDWAFITQPGRMPFRERMNNADDRAFESLKVAERFRDKAENLRHVRVKGDAENKHQATRDKNDSLFQVGDTVESWIVGRCKILKINKKTYTIQCESSGRAFTQDKSLFKPVVIERASC